MLTCTIAYYPLQAESVRKRGIESARMFLNPWHAFLEADLKNGPRINESSRSKKPD